MYQIMCKCAFAQQATFPPCTPRFEYAVPAVNEEKSESYLVKKKKKKDTHKKNHNYKEQSILCCVDLLMLVYCKL